MNGINFIQPNHIKKVEIKVKIRNNTTRKKADCNKLNTYSSELAAYIFSEYEVNKANKIRTTSNNPAVIKTTCSLLPYFKVFFGFFNFFSIFRFMVVILLFLLLLPMR